MSKSVVRLLVIVTMLAGAAGLTPAEARTHTSNHIKKHKIKPAVLSRRLPSADQTWRAQPFNQPAEVCQGAARSFDCKIWPPPMDQDPDRKTSGTDGG
jgi:hypothetical protein